MKIYLLVFPIVFGVAAFGANHILAQTENKEVIPVVEVSPPEPKIEPVVEEKTDPELICLAMNIYHEARNQSMAGQMAVALVTMNRVNDPRYPNTICEVVMEGPTRTSWVDKSKEYPIKHRCQFSWYCDGLSDTVKDFDTFIKITKLADIIITQLVVDITDGATHYHADYVKPSWAATKTRTTKIDDHIFYRWEK
jgi:spore germination cell wall hydrolase CwlJ-like protein|tara:strand:- start:776 stop:1360 length:585 start_codon:yes stop_codon:yes gene_type:complete